MPERVQTSPSEMRRDRLTGISVIIVKGRDGRPKDIKISPPESSSDSCDLCPGQEDKTPAEIMRLPKDGNPWKVRVMPNKWAIMRIEGQPEFDEGHRVNYHIRNARGAHELIIMTPDHHDNPATLGTEQWSLSLEALIDRQHDLYYNMPDIEFIQSWMSYGHEAGASLIHPHMQLIYMPTNPLLPIITNAAYYHDEHRHSIFEKIINEAKEDEIIFVDRSDFVAFCPYASIQPFMVRIIPKFTASNLDQNRVYTLGLAQVLNECFVRLRNVIGYVPSLNITFHEIPYRWRDSERFFRFWIDIIPQINKAAGFEWGAFHRIFVNSTLPEEAARLLREVQT